MQVDNDSFPILGNFLDAVSWLESRNDALALAFTVTNRKDYFQDHQCRLPAPFPCQYFIGCAALIKRELFLDLGGYDEILEYHCEEVELALRAQSRGLHIYQYSDVVVQHNRSSISRDRNYRALLVVRNELLLACLRYPLFFLLIRWPTFVLKALIFKWFPRSATAGGVIAALRLLPLVFPRMQAISIKSFLRWKSLPAPITIK